MKNRQGVTIPNAVLKSGEDKYTWLKDIKNLSIGELIELYAYAEAIVETVREPLIILDKDLKVKSANKSFFDMFCVAKKETYGKYIYEVNGGEWNIPALRTLLEKILPKNSFFNDFEVEHNFKTIGEKIMLLNARRIILEENKTQLILLAIEDITARKAIEKHKEEFLNQISHELRTPITSMRVFLDIVQKRLENKGNKEDSQLLEKLSNQVDKLNTLVEEVLNVNRVKSGKLLIHKKKTDLDLLITKVVTNYQYIAENNEILRKGEIKEKIICDEYRIEQVLTNLLTNAIKYSPKGGKIIIKSGIKDNHVLVSVKDSGIGIPKKDHKKVFEQYYRTNEEGKEKIVGFGLGLFISAKIIEGHGGRIWVKSK